VNAVAWLRTFGVAQTKLSKAEPESLTKLAARGNRYQALNKDELDTACSAESLGLAQERTGPHRRAGRAAHGVLTVSPEGELRLRLRLRFAVCGLRLLLLLLRLRTGARQFTC
jgi:hypothetical protein